MEEKVLGLLPDYVLNSPIFNYWEKFLNERNISIKKANVTGGCKDYLKLFQEYPNIITWNCRTKHSWIESQNKNVLFIDNSLLIQASGIFLDNGGFFSDSNLRKRCSEKEEISEQEKEKIKDMVNQKFKQEFLSHQARNNKVLVALQHHLDSNINFQFPFGEKFHDKIEATLCFIKTFLPEKLEVTLRPHPRFLHHWHENVKTYQKSFWNSDWKVDLSKSAYQQLADYQYLVSVNSTLVQEAFCLGMPVATLGVGTFTGHETSLECAQDFKKLSDLESFSPNTENITQYVYKVWKHNVLHHKDSFETVISNEEWRKFVNRL
jgi:hypothetical protein